MSDDNIVLVRRWFEEIWNCRRPQVIDELLTAESVCHGEDGPIRGPDEFRQRQYDPFTSAFPDLHLEVDAIIGQGDVVVVRWSAAGTHSGDGLGFPATHKTVSFRGLTWVHVRDGKMVEGWQSSNIPEVIRGLPAMSAG